MISLQIVIDANSIQQAFMLGFISFVVSMLLTPLYTTAAFAGQWWKKVRTHAMGGVKATVFHKLHASKHERNIPTMAGIIFVLSTLIVTVGGNLSRSETWLPLAAMVGAGLIGLIDDVINIRGSGGSIAGLQTKLKASLLLGVALIGGWWFFAKLGVTSVHLPFLDSWELGWLIIPLFVLVVFATGVAVNMSDGLDGLAVLTDTVFLLPVIGIVFVVEVASVIINRVSRKLRNGKKVFLSSPIHHHFEAIGWPETKVTMRFWVIGEVAAFVGVILFILGGPQ
jgi:UDP-N-acetylmuramyl pentapeptide phosphotransferase/UDP-N-acetylglucosamine-1-phosphate transferase